MTEDEHTYQVRKQAEWKPGSVAVGAVTQGSSVLAIDPGNEQSAYLLYDGQRVIEFGIIPNDELLMMSVFRWTPHMAIEGVQCYGMPVGKEVFDTCIWIGRFMQRFGPSAVDIVYRSDIKLYLCNSARAKDPHIRQALIDRFGPGKDKAIGKKKSPGPLYGIKSHCWSALAVAVFWWHGNENTLISGGQ